MNLEVTPNFVEDKSIREAMLYLSSNGHVTEDLVLAWCKVARMVLKTGKFQLRKKAIKEVSTVVQVDERTSSVGIDAMLKTDMLRHVEGATNGVLEDEKFEQFWEAYPKRFVAGKWIKVGKSNAKKRFAVLIRDEETFQLLMLATKNYSTLCNKLPKDAERFLKENYWKEYIPEQSSDKRTVTSSDLDSLINAASKGLSKKCPVHN
jgi:hypothetical protein